MPVIDNTAGNLLLMQLFRATEDYQVEVADSSIAALAKSQISSPELALLDVMVPAMNGFEVKQNLRDDKSFFLLPILLVTADGEAALEQAQAVEVNEVICKPIDINDPYN